MLTHKTVVGIRTRCRVTTVQAIPRKFFRCTRITHPVFLQPIRPANCHHGLGCSHGKGKSSAALSISRAHSGWAGVWHLAWRQARRRVGLLPAPPPFSQPLRRGTSGCSSGCRPRKRHR